MYISFGLGQQIQSKSNAKWNTGRGYTHITAKADLGRVAESSPRDGREVEVLGPDRGAKLARGLVHRHQEPAVGPEGLEAAVKLPMPHQLHAEKTKNVDSF